MAEALFLKGWINLSYLRNTRAAYKDFYALYTTSKTPVSKARAAYWAAQAAKKNGNPEIKNQWLEKAASRSFSFFGQLAYEERYPGKPLPFPDAPTPSASEDARFNSEELVRLVRALASAKQHATAERFLKHLAETADTPTRFALIATLARTSIGPHAAVKVAKQALRDGVVLVKAGWPLRTIPDTNTIEPALALAIIRQESEFDAEAVSPANARGLMQLLPATARETARNNRLAVDARDLFNPAVNILLGMHYLHDMIAFMNGSYVLGIASYNAGPGNVRDWRKTLGHPGESPEGAIHWIENIPFAETRNYVMRVLENLQIYRRLLDENATPQVTEDLVR
jgi:soluble lytic murein transglycosylase